MKKAKIIHLTEDTKKRLSILAVKEGKSLKKFIESILEKFR